MVATNPADATHALVAASCGTTTAAPVLAACRQQQACGALRRASLVQSLAACVSQQQQQQQQQPLETLALVRALASSGLFTTAQLLRQLWPRAADAAAVIQQAASSQDSVLSLLSKQGSGPEHPLHALLSALLGACFDAASTTAPMADAPAALNSAAAAPETPAGQLQQYVEDVVTQLQQAACRQQVRVGKVRGVAAVPSQHASDSSHPVVCCTQALAVCLVRTADSCALLHDDSAVQQWLQRFLQQLLQAYLSPAPAASNVSGFRATGSTAVVRWTWPAAALQHQLWRMVVPPVLRHVQPQILQQLLQDSLASTACHSVRGIAALCSLLGTMAACGRRATVLTLVSAWAVAATCMCVGSKRTPDLPPTHAPLHRSCVTAWRPLPQRAAAPACCRPCW
jgi:hypothetical protein